MSRSAGVNGEPPEIDTTKAHPARVYDYLLGGSDHFTVDQEMAEHVFSAYRGGVDTARADVRANRAFLGRAVRWLAVEAGVRQFLDIGTGIPTADGNNVHEVAQQANPQARVVYVDNDTVVLAHAHNLLNGRPEGTTAYIHGDLRNPQSIVGQAAGTLDFDQPVAVLLVGVLHFISHDEDPYRIVARLLDAVPAGSYLVVSHLANDIQPEQMAEVTKRTGDQPVREPAVLRDLDEVTRFFSGLEVVEPGVVRVDQWRPAKPTLPTSGGWLTPIHCGVGRKP